MGAPVIPVMDSGPCQYWLKVKKILSTHIMVAVMVRQYPRSLVTRPLIVDHTEDDLALLDQDEDAVVGVVRMAGPLSIL